MISLRPYQQEAITAIEAAAAAGTMRPLCVMPTGAGKTVTFAHLVQRRGGRALILAHRDELIQQAADKLRQIAPELRVGVVKAGDDEHDAQVVVASVQTLVRPSRLERLDADFRTIVVDEAHHAVASTYRTVLDRFGAFRDRGGPLVAGFTATAGRSDGAGLGHVWQDIVYQRGILQMIAEKYLVNVRALAVSSEMDLGNVRTRAGDFVDGQLGDELERSGAIDAAAVSYKRFAPERPGIAFTPTVATSQALTEALRAQGITADHIDGAMPRQQRRDVLARLRKGDVQVVTNCAVLTEGFDEPAVSCVLMARPTKSAPLFVQMVGRALRPHPGKDDALVLDVAGASAAGLATIADLAGLPPKAVKPGEKLTEAAERAVAEGTAPPAVAAAVRAKSVDLFKASDLRWLPVLDCWMLPAGRDTTILLMPADGDLWNVWECTRTARPKIVSPGLALEWARGVGEEVARAKGGVLSRADARWRARPPSPAQLQALQRMGYAEVLPKVQTCGQASDLMSAHNAARIIRSLRAAA
ncbi:DEAD/DEAH box helicase [Allonocardiopsis opalescens]|uniref:Superfamily II DNA or RNA helicase n=1 Tax=Allonocardiopsis opalescens TaxID=1144618 RepID=A0A2T0PPL8_9ACTN|nr:DEAD/DEAH box helicase [Allonocardiopsis opalescens]PRX90849.1 superfamily II DNA or RNA helicase [Allonocardiopsis opalescens]